MAARGEEVAPSITRASTGVDEDANAEDDGTMVAVVTFVADTGEVNALFTAVGVLVVGVPSEKGVTLAGEANALFASNGGCVCCRLCCDVAGEDLVLEVFGVLVSEEADLLSPLA